MGYRFNNFYELILTHGIKRGRKVALFVGKEKIRYRDLLERVDRFAGFLQSRGVKEGDKVALFLRNSPEFIITLFALSKLGAIAVPINTFLKSEELQYILEDSGAILLVASTSYEKVVQDTEIDSLCSMVIWEGDLRVTSSFNVSFEEALGEKLEAKAVMRKLDDTAVIIYTSGTTGKPKGAMLSYKNIFSNCEAGAEHLRITGRDRVVVFLPMFHSFTLSICVILFLYVGGSIVLVKSIKPFNNIFKQVLLKRVTIFIGIPDVYNALAKAKLPWYFMWFNNLRAFISGAAALQEHTLMAMEKKFKNVALLEGYGLSEAAPAVCVNPLNKPKARSVGPALPGYTVKVVDENLVELPRGEVGDIITRGDNIMQCYLNKPEATAETIINGWLLTGDMGSMDEEGYLYIADRKKDLIISKGINIYPKELEEVIDRFEGIAASAVVGI
ncbi:MAG TPA: long-chain fatty acid--CoA ligase, partial [Epsilonproteobacteria bacterium]|nr:long-chain fatty acid--CoA ligase [Campylobacterota bacterium]